jgi:hypothetical protein
MASRRPDPRRPARAAAFAIALLLPLAALAQDQPELMLCGSGSTANNGAGFIDTLAGPNPPAPPGGTTNACMPVLSFDTGLTRSAPVGPSPGAPRPGKITVVMPSGPNAVRLSALLGRGTIVADLSLLRTVRSGGGARRLAFAVVLRDAVVESSQTSALRGDDAPIETIVLNYQRIRWLHWLDPLAGTAPTSELCFNAAMAQTC